MNARAIARHYAMLAGYGTLDGRRLLSTERIDMIRAPQVAAVDEVSARPSLVGLGYQLAGDTEKGGVLAMGRSGEAFGHAGNGGSLGFADPARNLSFGLTKNLMTAPSEPTKTAAYQIAEAIRQHLDTRTAS